MIRSLFLSLLITVVSCMTPISLKAESKPHPHILMLVTQADKMTSGKPTGLWLEEYAVPYNLFKAQGYVITTATLAGGKAPIDNRSKPNDEQAKAWAEPISQLNHTLALDQVDIEPMDAIFIPGGHGVMFDLASSKQATKVIETFLNKGKFIAAVCHGPAALVNVKNAKGEPMVRNKKMTGFSNDEEEAVKLTSDMPFLLETRLKELGAKVITQPRFTPFALHDGQLITGQNPASSEHTADLLIEAIKQKQKLQ